MLYEHGEFWYTAELHASVKAAAYTVTALFHAQTEQSGFARFHAVDFLPISEH